MRECAQLAGCIVTADAQHCQRHIARVTARQLTNSFGGVRPRLGLLIACQTLERPGLGVQGVYFIWFDLQHSIEVCPRFFGVTELYLKHSAQDLRLGFARIGLQGAGQIQHGFFHPTQLAQARTFVYLDEEAVYGIGFRVRLLGRMGEPAQRILMKILSNQMTTRPCSSRDVV